MNFSNTMELLSSYVLVVIIGIVGYVFTALALYKMAKVEGYKRPWLAWIPITSPYLLIKLGDGKILFLIVGILSLFTGNFVNGFMEDTLLKYFGIAVSAVWTIYSLIMYLKISDRYEVSALYFVIGLIFELIPSMLIIGVIILAIGNFKLYRSACKDPKTRRVVTRSYHTKGSIKPKEKKKKSNEGKKNKSK